MICERCGMYWLGAERPVELMPGMWTHGRVTTHICPEPFPRAVAESLVQMAQAHGGIVVHPRFKARIKLGLEA